MLAAAVLLGGCASVNNFYHNVIGYNQDQQVTPEQFQSTAPPGSAGAEATVGPIDSQNPRISPSFQPAEELPPTPAAPAPLEEQRGISRVVARTIGQPTTNPTTQETQPLASQTPPPLPTAPTLPAPTISSTQGGPIAPAQPGGPAVPPTTPATPSVASGEYLPLGGVVAEVNGTPIFIKKVLRLVEPGLKNDAAAMGPDQFAASARDHIEEAIKNLKNDELEYAAAFDSLDANDKKMVSELTTAYRQTLITQAGGSLEMARLKAAANGDDFEDLVHEQYRKYMILLYWQRNFFPLTEPSAQEMRDYYNAHISDFSEPSEAQFDLLQVDPTLLGTGSAQTDKQMAYDRAKQAHDRSVAGENFATIFKEYNNVPGLDALTGGTGLLAPVQRGSFSLPQSAEAGAAVENAVWNLEPGQTTDVIDVDGELYVAKLVSRKLGVVHPFEDEVVQSRIRQTIEGRRLADLQDQKIESLNDEAIVTVHPEMLDTAVEMAMANYYAWRAAK